MMRTEEEINNFVRVEVEYQEKLETARYRSSTCAVLGALQSLVSTRDFEVDSAVTAPPFFASAG